MKKQINIIDLFAGPGGLGEGFFAYKKHTTRPFKIRMSVEMEENAHRTLQLRAFYRQFSGNPPDEYYDYIRNPSKKARDKLFEKFPKQAAAAIEETMAQPRELGKKSDDQVIEKQLKKIKRKTDGPFVVIGGPPCQAYSNAGKSRNAGKEGYSLKKDKRASLYKEYLNVLNIIEPEVFVMENVKGILSSEIDGKLIFDQILQDLRDPKKAIGKRTKYKYNIYSLVQKPDERSNKDGPVYRESKSFTINFEKFGVPQQRHRVILLGIRSKIKKTPKILEALYTQIPIDSIIDGMPPLRSGPSYKDFNKTQLKSFDSKEWAKTIKNIGNDLAKRMQKIDTGHARVIRHNIKNIRNDLEQGGKFLVSRNNGFKKGFSDDLVNWLYDTRIGGFINHETRGHLKDDLKRYFWASTFAETHKNRSHPSPKAHEYPGFLAPNHKNWESGSHADRFRVQVRNKPSTTVTCHISKDGHYYIHYDPTQCRSLTVREAARLQTFPDNYLFEGGRTAQYVQVGNAVPPYLATQIADIVFHVISQK